MRLVIILLSIFIFIQTTLTAQVNTTKSTLSYTLGRETLERVNVTRNAAGLLTLRPVAGQSLNLGTGTVPVVATAQWTYPNDPNKLDLFILGRVGTADRPFYCTTDFTTRQSNCKLIGAISAIRRFQISGGFRPNTTRGFLSLVGGDAMQEFSQGSLWNINTDTLGAKFPIFTGADRFFSPGRISSTAVNKSVTNLFQIVFSETALSTLNIRKLNNVYRPAGVTARFNFPQNVLIASGSISNIIGAGPGQPPKIFFAYRAFRNLPPLQTSVQILVLNANSLQPIGEPKVIIPFTNVPDAQANFELTQSVSIHPSAHYVAFGFYSPSCSRDIVRTRALDANGNGKGPIRTSVPCSKVQSSQFGAAGLDVTFRY
jgi:hypothetical protein